MSSFVFFSMPAKLILYLFDIWFFYCCIRLSILILSSSSFDCFKCFTFVSTCVFWSGLELFIAIIRFLFTSTLVLWHWLFGRLAFDNELMMWVRVDLWCFWSSCCCDSSLVFIELMTSICYCSTLWSWSICLSLLRASCSSLSICPFKSLISSYILYCSL